MLCGPSFVYSFMALVSISRPFGTRRPASTRQFVVALGALAASFLGCTKVSAVDPFLPAGDRLSFQSQPSSIVAGVPFGFKVRIVDTSGANAVLRNGVDIALSLDSTDPRDTLLGQTVVQTAFGEATFGPLVLKRAASSFRIIATSRGLTGAVSVPFAVAVGAAAKLAFSVQPSTVIAGEIMVPPPQVLVQDATGNTVANDSGLVLLQVLTGVNTQPVNATVTARNGVARFDSLRIKATATNFTLQANSPGRTLTTAVTNVFAVTHGTPRKIVFSQAPGTNSATVPFNPPLAATVTDSMGNVATTFSQAVTLEFDSRPPGNTAVLSGTTTLNAVAGVATFSGISIDLTCFPGTCYKLRAVSATEPDTARSNNFIIVP